MKISVKLYFSTAIATGLICLLAIFVSQYSLKIKAAQGKADIASQLVNQTTHLIIILDEYLAHRYERSEQQWQKISTTLAKLSEHLPAEDARPIQSEMEEIGALFSRLQLEPWLNSESPEPSSTVVFQGSSAELRDRLSSQIQVSSNNILTRAFSLSQQAGKDIETINQKTFSMVLFLSTALIFLLIISSVVIIRSITQPLNTLIKDAEKIEQGDLDHTVTIKMSRLGQNNKSEIGKLTQAFFRMTVQLTGIIQSLKLSEDRYRTLFESVGVSLWEEDYSEIQVMLEELKQQSIKDIPTYIRDHPEFVAEAAQALKISEVNSATLKLYHANSKEELLGSLDKVFVPESFAVFCEELIAIAEGREGFEAEAVNGTLDGNQINVLMTVSFPAEFKKMGRLTVSIADITEIKQAEMELAQYRNQLEQVVGKRTQELTEKTEQLQKSEKSLMYLLEDVNESREQLQKINSEYAVINNELKEFSYVVSHDLKAPLRAIGQLTHWISTDYSTAFDDDGKMQMDLILQRVKRMDGLIDGILRYSRVGRTREKSEPLDLDRLVREVVENIVSLETVQIVIENKLPVVLRDSIRMEQVFQNLIGNAIKFMDKDEGLIKVGCVDGGASWQFSVSDNGPGIDKKYHDRIFQIFQTLAPRDERENTGIGLTLVKKIIGIYGGSIWVESELGRGTTFYFTVPKKEKMDEKL